MRLRVTMILAAAILCLTTSTGWAAVPLDYSQDFEALTLTDPNALANDGWLVYGNVFDPDMNYIRGYGAYPAPNGDPPHFCSLVSGEGGIPQGAQQLSVFSDYENQADQTAGNWIESNVYQERTITADYVGLTWYFEFDAKRGNIEGGSTALAFIKTLDPNNGWALTNFITVDMTSIPVEWQRYGVSIGIDGSLIDQVLQFGFANTATHNEGSGIFYDNGEFSQTTSLDVPHVAVRGTGIALSARGNPATGQAAQALAFTTPRDGRVTVRIYDVNGAVVATLLDGTLAAGAHQATWRGRDASGRALAAGTYFAEVKAGADRAVVKLSRLK